MAASNQIRQYHAETSIVFLKTNEKFGGLSNMAPSYPIYINQIKALTSEALYQASRYPHLPEVQRMILQQSSPMTAKMKSRKHKNETRPNWEQIRVPIMKWCLKLKLAQNWKAFGSLLLATQNKAIVEQSRKDTFWGAKSIEDGSLQGMNVLGRLLMELRENITTNHFEKLEVIAPPPIQRFYLLNEPITEYRPNILLSIDELETNISKLNSQPYLFKQSDE